MLIFDANDDPYEGCPWDRAKVAVQYATLACRRLDTEWPTKLLGRFDAIFTNFERIEAAISLAKDHQFDPEVEPEGWEDQPWHLQ